MVIVFLRGGLGNQMFQYAAGLAVAKKHGTALALDTVFLSDRFPRKEFTYRTYDLGAFTLGAPLTPLSRIAAAAPVPGLWLGLDLALIKAKSVLGWQTVFKENQEHAFDPAIFNIKKDLLLWGRWQNEKYFAHIAKEVADAFKLAIPLTGEAAKIAESIGQTNAVSLHVRRGDYAAFKSVEALHGKTDLSYYSWAAAYIGSKVPSPHFFVFSDDIPWSKENLKLPFSTTFVEQSAAGPHDVFHLELMSLCKHNIITNSTFSWWGAWRNPNPEKIVIAPHAWYPGAHDAEDMVPAGWIKAER